MKLFEQLSELGIETHGCGDGGPYYGELRKGDHVFLGKNKLSGDGYIYLAKLPGQEKQKYYRLYWTDDDTITVCCLSDGDIMGVYPAGEVEIAGRVLCLMRDMGFVPFIDTEKSRLADKINGVDTGNYDISIDEVMDIRARRKGSPYECIIDAYKYGFLRGQRSEKNKRKRSKAST